MVSRLPSPDRPWEGYLTRENAQAAFDLIATMIQGPRLHTAVTVIGDRPPEVRSGQRAQNIKSCVPEEGRAYLSWEDDSYYRVFDTSLNGPDDVRGASEHDLIYIKFSEDKIEIRARNGHDKQIYWTFSLEGR